MSIPLPDELLRSCLKSPRGEQITDHVQEHDLVKIKPKDTNLEIAFIHWSELKQIVFHAVCRLTADSRFIGRPESVIFKIPTLLEDKGVEADFKDAREHLLKTVKDDRHVPKCSPPSKVSQPEHLPTQH